MTNERMRRLITGFVFALMFMLVSARGVQASPSQQEPPPGSSNPDCRECHWDVYISWEASAHGQGLSCGQCHLADQQDNHARLGHGAQGGPQQCMSCHTTGYDPETDTWQEDNIHCTACHSPVTANHPDEPMPTNRSEELCGQCHIQARFEWEVSQHGQAGVGCVNCHDQHNTSLKSSQDNVSEQCAVCHETLEAGFTTSMHAQQGLTCGDCHLSPLDGPVGEGSAKLNHTFEVDLATCVNCHMQELHQAAETSGAQPVKYLLPSSEVDAMASGKRAEAGAEQTPANPLGFIAVAGLAGLGVGLVSNSGLAHQLRRFFKKK